MGFRYQTQVRFRDADPAGIAFFGRLFDFCHDAYEELMRQGGAPLEQLMAQGVGVPLSNASAEFSRPLPHGARVTVEVQLAELKPKGFSLVHRLLNASGELCAQVRTGHVAVSRADGRPTVLPPSVVRVLSSLSEVSP